MDQFTIYPIIPNTIANYTFTNLHKFFSKNLLHYFFSAIIRALPKKQMCTIGAHAIMAMMKKKPNYSIDVRLAESRWLVRIG